MEPPESAEVTETSTSTMWFDAEGILCSIAKKGAPRTLEETKLQLEKLKLKLNGKMVCLLIDVTNSGESTREVRDYVAEEFPKFVKAIAVLSSSELGKMIANLFFNIKHQPYPTKMFTNEAEAKDWLRQYL